MNQAMKFISLIGAGLIILSSGCTSVKRFRSASYRGEDPDLVDMELFGTRLEPPGDPGAGKSLWDLSPSAQTQMIQILHERYPDNSAFLLAMNRKYLLGDSPAPDFTSRNLRMVFTISKQQDHSSFGKAGSHFSPADRIESLKFSLELPPESGLRFREWNRYATEYGDLELAEVSFSRSLEVETQASGEVAKGSLKGSLDRREEQEIRSRTLVLNGSISDHRLEIREEGTREIDLAGNVIADVALEFKQYPERLTIPLFSSGADSPPGAVPLATGAAPRVTALGFVTVMVPRMEEAPERLVGKLELEYIYRHVESGWKTFQEWDDRVAWYKGRVVKEVTLFEKQDYVPAFSCIGTDTGRTVALRVRLPGGQEFPLHFSDPATAAGFLDWLIRGSGAAGGTGDEPVQIGDHRLLYGDEILTRSMLAEGLDLKVLPVY
jgi:hypothetical protein